jgi:hypothetical protein
LATLSVGIDFSQTITCLLVNPALPNLVPVGIFFDRQGFSEYPQNLFQNIILDNTLVIGYFSLISNTKFTRLVFLPQGFARLSKRLGTAGLTESIAS